MRWFRTEYPPKAFNEADLHCIYVARPVGKTVCQISRSKSLAKRWRTLQSHCYLPILIEQIVWFEGQESADLALGMVRDALSLDGRCLRGDWYRASESEIENLLLGIAQGGLFRTLTHDEMLEWFDRA